VKQEAVVDAIRTRKGRLITEPSIVSTLLNDPRMGWLWLVIRVWVGYQWVEAGWHKVTSAAWVGGGAALQGYWQNAIVIPDTGRPAIAFGWYRDFLTMLLNAQAYTWFAKLIAYGEFLVGIALILGAFTGVAAIFGGLMNWNYMMAGSASTNPMLFLLSVGIILAWKVAGHIGADYFLLPAIGTPWRSTQDARSEKVQRVPQPSPAAGD
jgi:thiosulfate dehydrogenase [quinone] large subunit